jgi:hypothetical protein
MPAIVISAVNTTESVLQNNIAGQGIMENSKYSLNGLLEILTRCPVFGSYLILLITFGSNSVKI